MPGKRSRAGLRGGFSKKKSLDTAPMVRRSKQANIALDDENIQLSKFLS
jgi:hypothetical protein